MEQENEKKEICYLCGKNMENNCVSRDHVPPLAFYPKNIRKGLNLEVLFSHEECNNSYRKDEEYFLHVFFIEVQNKQPLIAKHFENDFYRRAQKPQTQAMIRRILKETSNITPGGIHLPHGKYAIKLERSRIERVVWKVVRGLFFLENKSYLPFEVPKDIKFCLNKDDVPDLYKIHWPAVQPKGVYMEAFSYRYFSPCKYYPSGKYPSLDNLHLYSLFFWEACIFCVAFKYPL